MVWNSTWVEAWWKGTPLADDRLWVSVLANLTRLVEISLPLVILFLVILVLSWRRERKALADHMPLEGVTPYTAPEIMLHRRRRWGALLRALQERGLRGWRTAARLQRILIEWALMRWHRAEGHLAEGVDADQIKHQYQVQAAALAQSLSG